MPHSNGETHVFTDYRWDDGSIVRRWLVDPSKVDLAAVILHPFTLRNLDKPDQ